MTGWLQREWADGMVIFDLASGDTHLLDTAQTGAVDSELLRALRGVCTDFSIVKTCLPDCPPPTPR